MEPQNFNQNLLYRNDTHAIIGLCMRVHQDLGHGFLEIVYKDAIELELMDTKISFDREKEYVVKYRGRILPHKFHADFVVLDKIVLEIKAARGGIADDQIAQLINYLRVSKCRVGLLMNFGKERLEFKRIVL